MRVEIELNKVIKDEYNILKHTDLMVQLVLY